MFLFPTYCQSISLPFSVYVFSFFFSPKTRLPLKKETKFGKQGKPEWLKRKDRDRRNRTRGFYHIVWVKHGWAITRLWLWSALSHRQPLPAGLNSADLWGRGTTQTTGSTLISLIITSQENHRQKTQRGRGKESAFLCIFLHLFVLVYFTVFIPDHESALQRLKPKQWPQLTHVSPTSLCRKQSCKLPACKQMQWYTSSSGLAVGIKTALL